MAVPIVWALLLVGGRFAIRPLAQVAAKNLRYVKAHINSVKQPRLTGTPQNPNGVITKAGNLSKANNITPVGTPGWSGDFLKAALNPKAANLVTKIRLYGTKKAVTQLAGMGISIAALEATIDDNAKTEYNVLTGQEVLKGGIRQDIEERANRLIAANKYQDPRIPRREDRQPMIDAELRRNRVQEGRNIAELYRRQLAKDNPGLNPDTFINAALGRQRQPRGSDFITEQRITAEKEAIAEADSSSPKFTSAELAPYKKIAESEFGQKLFGLRRSAPEIERDVTYTDLKMQGRDEEADKYWSDWNAENKAKKDAALGEGKSLTESTMNDANIASAAKEFSTVVKEKLPTSKKGGGRVSSRPKSYRTAKVMKKYAKGGSVRKPKRI